MKCFQREEIAGSPALALPMHWLQLIKASEEFAMVVPVRGEPVKAALCSCSLRVPRRDGLESAGLDTCSAHMSPFAAPARVPRCTGAVGEGFSRPLPRPERAPGVSSAGRCRVRWRAWPGCAC